MEVAPLNTEKQIRYVTITQFVAAQSSVLAILLSLILTSLGMFKGSVFREIDVQKECLNSRISSLSTDVDIMQQMLMEERYNRDMEADQCDIVTAELRLSSWQQEDLRQVQSLLPMAD